MIFNAPANLAPALAKHIKERNPHGTTAADVGAVPLASLMALAHQALDASGNQNWGVITEYPTTPGVYQVGAVGSMNLPGEWGTLLIFNGGNYWLHIFSGLCYGAPGLWWAWTEGIAAVTTWNKVADTEHNHNGQTIRPLNIEFGTMSGSGHGGFVDFHYDGSAEDFTSRIIEYVAGIISIVGSLRLENRLILSSECFGDEFPSNPVEGQLFFKRRVT